MNAPLSLPARLPMPAEATGFGLQPHQWKVLADAVFPGAKTPEAIMLALSYCKARNLDIFKRPVSIVSMWNRDLGREVETVWPGINEVQVTAARTGKWAGMDPPRFGPDETRTFQGKNETCTVTFPEWCEVTVYRIIEGQRCAFTETVYWLETYSRTGKYEAPNEMWRRRTRSQLAKCAKAASLRAAFPEEGELTAEEMEGQDYAGGATIEAKAEAVEPPRRSPGPWAVHDDRGEQLHTAPTLEDALRRYGEVKAARSDKLAVAVNNLELLRAAAAAAPAGGELRRKIENEVAAAEAHLVEDEDEAGPDPALAEAAARDDGPPPLEAG